ncbi:pyridoxamine 5'-phosphate oxidase family protein [Haloarchaeobius sp. HRN-SO-5]|uniref:pyridoxamine 5'-phosphate oxidase family protein n=1 Tax=Haloarchaeobius sp. HRN-SO-5 TaxID=3446118 RepID=UPI003EB77383
MSDIRWIQLSEDERNAFLENGGTGVVSFSTDSDDPPYSLPVSYGYFADRNHFHFRFALPPDSTKDHLLDRPVSFVVHGETDEGWRSVVATGTLEELSDLPYESSALQERWAVDIPVVDIFEEPPDEVTWREFRLVPDSVSGRKAVGQ